MPDENENSQKEHIMKKFPGDKSMKKNLSMIIGVIVVVLAGVGTGWLLSGGKAEKGSAKTAETPSGVQQGKKEAGIEDESLFSDTAEGKLMQGGFEGEGTHYLDRGLGPEKNVYLTSTVIDLESFVGKDVQIWGETISAEHAPWLMDVGKIKVVE